MNQTTLSEFVEFVIKPNGVAEKSFESISHCLSLTFSMNNLDKIHRNEQDRFVEHLDLIISGLGHAYYLDSGGLYNQEYNDSSSIKKMVLASIINVYPNFAFIENVMKEKFAYYE